MTARLLCFGDSLTAGYHSFGSFAPYSKVLQDLLSKSCGMAVVVDHIGLSGWTTHQMVESMDDTECEDVCGEVWPGLRTKLRGAASSGKPFSHVFVLGGTNDLGGSSSTPGQVEVFLTTLHQTCLDHSPSTKTYAMTVPACRAERAESRLQKARHELNCGIRRLCEKNQRIGFIDVDQAMPNGQDLPSDAAKLWDGDGLHFSPEGSSHLGEVVFRTLMEDGSIEAIREH